MKSGTMHRGFAVGEDGRITGVALGSDFTAEHEWGIKDIKTAFGVGDDKKAIGMAKRIITRIPDYNGYTQFRSFTDKKRNHPVFNEETKRMSKQTLDMFGFGYCRFGDNGKPELSQVLPYQKPDKFGFGAAWQENSFLICGFEPEANDYLKTIFDSILAKDAIIMMGGSTLPAFDRSTLSIGIASRMPKKIIEEWEESDKKLIETKEAFEKSEIERKLRDAGKEWYALSPKLKDGSLIIWLNPMDQKKYRWGWFTVGELELWAEDKGPVVSRV